MLIETKFDLGARVWGVREQSAVQIVNCLTCQKTGRVKIGDETFTCPKCNGESQHDRYCGRKWFVDEVGTIGQVQTTHYDGHIAPYYADKLVQLKYMLDITGVGSGQIWDENDLFLTREEAESACARRNSVLPADEN